MIGPRQTVSRAYHPTLGEGRFVDRNGPTFFLADSGERVDCKLLVTGSTKEPEKKPIGFAAEWYSYFLVRTADGDIELDRTGREESPDHYRIKTKDGRVEWLVAWSSPRMSNDHRFEDDDGSVEEFEMVSSKRAGDWLHMKRRDGTAFVYKVTK